MKIGASGHHRSTAFKRINSMKRRICLIAASALFVLAGCDSPAPAESAAPRAIEPDIKISGAGGVDPAVVRAIYSNPIRTEDARERDARSKPEVVLTLLDLKPGQHVIDLLGGSGYYTDLMAAMTGPRGEVILHNNPPYDTFVRKMVQPRYEEDPIPGIRYLKSELDDMQLEPQTLDAALMVMSYHDLYYVDPGIGFNKTDVPLFFSQVHAALKPGGKLLIVDHSAKPGSGSSHAQQLHRIEREYAIADIEGNGFQLIESSDALSNPEDSREMIVFDADYKGKTDRFILLFEKE
jgi:predicted methyltransferase